MAQGVCAVVTGAPKEKPMAHWVRSLGFSNGAPMARWRMKRPRVASRVKTRGAKTMTNDKIVDMHTSLTTAQMAELLGMTVQRMQRNGYDLDLFDSARWLIENKVDLANRAAVVAAIDPKGHRNLGLPTDDPPGFVDAVVVVAGSSTLTYRDAQAPTSTTN
jgi:hypothetical protein